LNGGCGREQAQAIADKVDELIAVLKL